MASSISAGLGIVSRVRRRRASLAGAVTVVPRLAVAGRAGTPRSTNVRPSLPSPRHGIPSPCRASVRDAHRRASSRVLSPPHR
jgi:hypothetical protein